MRLINVVVLTFGALGCASVTQPDVLPGIPAGTLQRDLNAEQRLILCRHFQDAMGQQAEVPGVLRCANGHDFGWRGITQCVADFEDLPPDCPTFAASEIAFQNNLRDNCLSPDFDPNNYVGERGCAGP